MLVIIQLSDLVVSDGYLEGCALQDNKSTMILSVAPKGVNTEIKASVEGSEVTILVDPSGSLLDSACTAGCSGICAHVVAAALLYNRITLDNTDISEQLSKFTVKTDSRKAAFPCRIRIDRHNHIQIEKKDSDYHIDSLLAQLGSRGFATVVGLFPENFTFGQLPLYRSAEPLILAYTLTSADVSFSLPNNVVYFDKEGVAVDTESGAVWAFSSAVNETLSTILSVAVGYSQRDDLITAISKLGEGLNPDVILSGALNLEKIVLDEDADIVFKTTMKDGKIFLRIFLNNDETSIEFHPRKKNFDQIYPLNGRIYSLAPKLVANLRAALAESGFRQFQNQYVAPMSSYSAISAPESPLNRIGILENEQEIRTLRIPGTAADESEIILDVNADEQWFSFNIKLPHFSEFISSTELIEAVNQFESGISRPVVSDVNGHPMILENSEDFLTRISSLIDSSAMFKNNDRIAVAHLVKLLKSKNKKSLRSFVGPKGSKEKYLAIFDALSHGVLPELEPVDFSRVPLRKYQFDGFKWLSLLKVLGLGGILADEMGLGKTLQSLAMIKAEKGDLPSIVICPKTLVWSWDHEIEKFFSDMKRVVIDSLKPEERIEKWRSTQRELIITSYSVVVNDFAYLKDKNFETVIVDEAQHIKNDSTKRFKAISALKAKHRFALTGTPLENHIRDLWSIFQFVMPGLLGTKQLIDKAEKNNDSDELRTLRSVTSPFILRRLKSEILSELPELIVKEYPVEMTPKQKEIYLSVLLRGRADYLERGSALNKIEILAILSNLRLAADHPALVSQTENAPEFSGKIAAILELCEEIFSGGGRVLIFSQYVKMLRIIENAFTSSGIEYFYMDGDTRDRMPLVDRFNAGERDAFLLSLKVGGVGLNLTGADHIIIVDPWWNPAVEEQAWSRAHRIGQKKKVIVNKLYSKGTIEEKILDLHKKKRGMVDFFLSNSMKEPTEDFVKLIADLELAVK
ncbi:DEAD/DEAH box helicase [bacterium]|nr:DEAD/DEAH box helicase [bacterium]